MYLESSSKQSLEDFVKESLSIDQNKLDQLLEESYNLFQKNHSVFILDNQYDYFKDFVQKHQSKNIDHVLFVHLARRIHGDNDNNAYNLVDALVKKTALSLFLKKYNLNFSFDDYIKVFYKQQEIIIDPDNYSNCYLRDRFGYEYKNYSIKGFLFKDDLINNDFYHSGKYGPELFNHFFSIVDEQFLQDDFYHCSKYYRFEYLIPIEQVYFENYDDLTDIEKQWHIIIKTMQRLYNYKYKQLINDLDNQVIGIVDDQMIASKYLYRKTVL